MSTGDKESQFLLGISRHQHVELNHPQVNGRTMNCGPAGAPCVPLAHADPGPTPGPTSTCALTLSVPVALPVTLSVQEGALGPSLPVSGVRPLAAFPWP